MIDREKVIKGLERFKSDFKPFCGNTADWKMVDDAIAMLKEQKSVEPINSYGTFRCGNCRNIVGYNDGHGCGYQNDFCSKCGMAVKWE